MRRRTRPPARRPPPPTRSPPLTSTSAARAGFSHNQLVLWKYPSMVKVAELTGHTSRVLHMAQSPDGQTVVTAAADETLRFWKILSGDQATKKEKLSAASSVLNAASIR